MSKLALILVDIQNDYFPGWENPLDGILEANQKARVLLDYFRLRGLPLVFIQHISTRPGATNFLPGTHGIDIHENVQPLPDEVVFQKHFPNSFRETPLLDHLKRKQVESLVICGMMTHMCVDATVRAAFDYGFSVLLAEDACASKKLVFNDQEIPARFVNLSHLAAMAAVYARVLPVSEILKLINK